MDLLPVIEMLRHKRSVFHSEADFQSGVFKYALMIVEP